MTRLLFVPNSHTLLWLDLPGTPSDLVDAILRGDWQPPPPYTGLAERLNAYWQGELVIVSYQALASNPPHTEQRPLARRQAEILKGLVDGLTTSQIALRLKIAPRTVSYHVSRLKEIFGASTRAELIYKARSRPK